MGISDSSRTRVAPVLDRLLLRDPTGSDWLRDLLALPERADGHRVPLPEELGPLTVHRWIGQPGGEQRIAPPVALLEALLERRTTRPPADFGTRDARKRELRRRLFSEEVGAIAEAQAALKSGGFVDGAWYVFEGRTAVDAYLETDELIVLIEGKRTETGPTTKTEWMPVRHQILRNIDAVWDSRGTRTIVAFFVVEGWPRDEQKVPARWRDFVAQTVSSPALEASLPHRAPPERQAMTDSFAGATTWQAVCATLGVDWEEIRDLTWQPASE